jgi:hypothetical protein
MKCQSFPCVAAVFALTLAWALISSHAADETLLDTATIEAITGLNGVSNQTEGTFKVSKPRDDVSVTVEKTHMAPFMGLTSWAAFMPFGKDRAMVMGDMVLFEDHQHMTGENPRMIFLHYYGRGKALDLARGVKAAINTEPLAANN